MSFIIFVLSTLNADSIVDIINNDPTSTWVAVEYHPSIMSREKMKRRLGAYLPPRPSHKLVPRNDLPENFDSREQWPGLILGVRDQGDCGSCWAFAITSCAGDRLGVQGRGVGDLSPQDLVSCDTDDYGCGGSSLDPAWQWMFTDGVTTEQCIPYVSGSGRVPVCPAKCKDGSKIQRYRPSKWLYLQDSQMQDEIIQRGPIQVAFTVYDDFRTYKSGVYIHKTGAQGGGHAVLCLGWGVEDGTPYWLCQNSWGAEWGDQGYFKILRGDNHCGIESYAYTGHFTYPRSV
ncbi:putative Cathepsin B [Blattamonas nauphoetae]|uniref:Cathepsin B n=1 Tax=Blattamonas nauphoetae TaxID=2049346 RepID=A0ABQ9YAK5_9EUKA|nr:putative Cathepsin B [Blattamonas nauphoetae]